MSGPVTLHEPTGATLRPERVRTVCPADPTHGRVLDAPGERWAFYCSHQAHDGRPSTHSLGAAPTTRAFFTTQEVESGRLTETVPLRDCAEAPSTESVVPAPGSAGQGVSAESPKGALAGSGGTAE